MCGIYGVLSYKDKLKDMNELVDLLSMESAERGTITITLGARG